MLIFPVDLQAKGLKRIAVLCKMQFQQNALFRIKLRPLIICIKDKIAQ